MLCVVAVHVSVHGRIVQIKERMICRPRQRGENEELEKIKRQLLLDFNLGTCISEIE
jgi:hypothetical protein